MEKNGKWGFIDREGRVVISPQFDYSRAEPTITQFSEGLAGVTKNGKFGYVDKTGAYVIGPTFTKGFEFRDGIAEVCNSNVCGYIDRHGTRIWPKAPSAIE